MKTQTIYWATYGQDDALDLEPKSLMVDLAETQAEHKGENYIACPSIRDKHRNTYVTSIPYDIDVRFGNNYFSASDELIEPRLGLYEDSYAFNWNLSRIFFSEHPQLMETSPAFLHKTSYSKYGHAPSGAFDISKWFRPSSPTFQLWSGVEKFSAQKGEKHLYFNFSNSAKVKLQQFNMTEELYKISKATVEHKKYFPKENLESLYIRFTRSGLNKKVLQEIKNNLI